MSFEFENKIRAKMEGLLAVKGEIYEDLLVVHEKLEAAQAKVKANLKSAENPEGVLTGEEKVYFDCLRIKKE